MGTPDFAVEALKAIHAAGHEVIAVYCQPPRPAGRGYKLQPSAVETYARTLNIPVYSPLSLKKDATARQEFIAMNADVAVVAAYGLILPQEILDAPKFGCLNIHGSLLPRWRGAAPVQRAILAGDSETGICIMQMDKGLDTGAVLLKESTPITSTTTTAQLFDTLATMGGRLIVQALAQLETLTPTLQPNENITYAHMLSKDDGRIDWHKSAIEIERQMRALPVWCMVQDKRLKIIDAIITDKQGRAGEILDKNLTVACGEKALLLKTVQPQDKKPMDGASFVNGAHLNVGDFLT
jgi:methionyl-tRNA formyltransferase